MTIQDHIEEINFAVSDIGNSDVYIGHDWLKQHNPTVDWINSRIFMNRCPHTATLVLRHWTLTKTNRTIDTNNDEEDPLVLEEGDRLFIFDIDGYLEQESNPPQKINRTNYDYVFKYDPQRTESKEWTDIVPSQYHDYEDVFTRKNSTNSRTTTLGSCYRPHPRI